MTLARLQTWTHSRSLHSSVGNLEAQDMVEIRWHVVLLVQLLLGIVLMVADEETRWANGPQHENGLRWLVPQSSDYAHAFDVVIPLANLVLLATLVYTYHVKSVHYMERWGLNNATDAFFSSTLRWKFAFEVFMALLQPCPRVLLARLHAQRAQDTSATTVASVGGEFEETWLEHIGLLMFLRMYTCVRTLRDFSPVYRRRFRAERLGFGPSRRNGFMMALRTTLKYKPLLSMIVTLTITLLTFSYCMFVVERSQMARGAPTTINSFSWALWFTIASATTAGYGDVSVSSSLAMVPASVSLLFGLVISALLVTVVLDKFTVKGRELEMYQWVRRKMMSAELERDAATIIRLVVADWYRRAKARKAAGVLPGMSGRLGSRVETVSASQAGGAVAGSGVQAGGTGAALNDSRASLGDVQLVPKASFVGAHRVMSPGLGSAPGAHGDERSITLSRGLFLSIKPALKRMRHHRDKLKAEDMAHAKEGPVRTLKAVQKLAADQYKSSQAVMKRLDSLERLVSKQQELLDRLVVMQGARLGPQAAAATAVPGAGSLAADAIREEEGE